MAFRQPRSEQARKGFSPKVHIPVVSSFRELAPAPQKFLLFTSFNVASWHCLIGPAMVLLARKIEMPPSLVGFLLSFIPLSMLLVAVTIRGVNRFGPKRVMMGSWISRYAVVCLVFLLPWALNHWSRQAGWRVLMASVLGFCIMRTFGAGAWFPWLHEVVPMGQRATYFSTETAIAQVVIVAVTWGQALVLGENPSLGRYMVLNAFGVFFGFVGVFWMSRVPGGEVTPQLASEKRGFVSHGQALKDKSFVKFTAVTSLCLISMSCLGSSVVMYMRDSLNMPSNLIMNIMATGSVGILLTIRSWERFTARKGSPRAMATSLTAYSLVAALWWVLSVAGRGHPLLVTGPIILSNVFSAAFGVAANRAMLNQIQPFWRAEYTSVWTVGTSLASAVPPILVGQAIDRWGLTGFRLCFAAAFLSGLICAIGVRWLVREGNSTNWTLSRLLDLSLPMRVLGRILWITVGQHETSRSTEERER